MGRPSGTGILDKSAARQGGAGAFWRESQKGEPQTPPAASVVPAGPTPVKAPT